MAHFYKNDVENSLICFFSSKNPIGAGFLISDRYAITCKHVIVTALRKSETEDLLNAEVEFDFPFLDHAKGLIAKVVFCDPENDVAVLEIESDLPEGAKPAYVLLETIGTNMWEHRFRAFGFPNDIKIGSWASGRILGKVVDGSFQIVGENNIGIFVQPGFSGGPVWDEELNRVVGLVVQVVSDREARTAFMLPIPETIFAWFESRDIIISQRPSDQPTPAPAKTGKSSPLQKSPNSKPSHFNFDLRCSLALSIIFISLAGITWFVSTTLLHPLSPTTTLTPSLTPTPPSVPSRTPTLTPIPSSTPSPTPTSCPYVGRTENETFVKLIQAEAIAANTSDISIMKTIFAPDAIFYDYTDLSTPKIWFGPIDRYEKDLFKYKGFRIVEHFDILPASPAVSADGRVFYTSGSRGQLTDLPETINSKWVDMLNGSKKTTQYGSEHWILKKNVNGCWVIIQMEFNAGLFKFP